MNPLKEIKTIEAPSPVGPYSQAIMAGGWLYCSGQIPIDPSNGSIVGEGDVAAQTQQVLKNLKAVLKASGCEISQVVKTTIFLADLNDFSTVNEIYSQTFNGPIPPARACVEVAAIPKGCLVEIECIALTNSK